ncbi:MAG: rRNA maturation RNase YbeY [Candidatus Levybacteria bacterium RIFCSPHIGHO2_02_FULL_37_10]|nr:MAG: rRNA maturation RNase YbeY [Candidatus Levybacteria bacterium RIFCSPHIGHO2_02_FULL_37_10]
MENIKILIFVESRYKVNRKRINSSVLSLLKEQGVKGPSEISVAVVGDRKMRELNKKYKDQDKTTNVLSFSLSEGDSAILPTDILRLGDVVISYPQIIKEASEEEVMVDDKIEELVNHGVLHLLGIHHEE